MKRYLFLQLVNLLLVTWGISIAVFVLIRLTGDPVSTMLPLEATEAQYDALRRRMGLDQPIPVQYWIWLSSALQGDFGQAFFHGRRPALQVVTDRVPLTLLLATAGLAASVLISVPLGILAAVKRDTWIDQAITSFGSIVQAMPGFWFGILLIILFAVTLGWLPVSGRADWSNLILPTVVLGINLTPRKMRLVRARMIDVLTSDYIRTARSKGLLERTVLWVHAFRNVAITFVTILGLQFASLVDGAIIVEAVFAWPGLGSLLISAIGSSDFPVIQAAVFLIAIMTVTVNAATDLVVAAIDPRIRLGR